MSVLVVVAHPDDEVLGAGIWLHRRANTDRHLLHITDGSPRDMHDAHAQGFTTCEAYAAARRQELKDALDRLGIPEANRHECSIPDKESYRHFPQLLLRLDSLIRELRPAVVMTHAYEGGHPDHDAAAFLVAGISRLRGGFRHLEFPLYHAGIDDEMIAGEFLPAQPAASEEAYVLSGSEQELKKELLACFRTQAEMVSRFPVECERFRESPAYDFTRPPHPGPLLYERWGWGIPGSTWRQEARRAAYYLFEREESRETVSAGSSSSTSSASPSSSSEVS